jgi:hypothetical protein
VPAHPLYAVDVVAKLADFVSVELVSVVVGVCIALVGWVVERFATRRALRRERVVAYLIEAYRQLDDASNRSGDTSTSEREKALERAISDIQLFGSGDHVRLADDFARAFVTERGADTTELLESLRRSLRDELHLGDLPRRQVFLRITHATPWMQASSMIRAGIAKELHAQASTPRPLDGPPVGGAADSVLARKATLDHRINALLGVTDPNATIETILDTARERLSPPTVEALEGLTIMANLARHDGGRTTAENAAEFGVLADGFEFTIRRELRK